MKGNTRCIEGRRFRHDPQHDDPELETDIGQCPDCEGEGCWDQEQDRYWKGAYDRMAARNHELTLERVELLATLQKIADMPPRLLPQQLIDLFIDIRLAARAAIAKATGDA